MSSMTSQYVSWFAVDWGTTNLRVWAMNVDGGIIAIRKSNLGMSKLTQADFEPALNDLITDLMPKGRNIPIIACGMVGSRQGWADAGYVATPCTPPSITNCVVPSGTKYSVHILSGVKQMKPADVMRGEETQIAGYLHEHPDFDGAICLPGTHTKWVHVSAGQIISFQTYMSGELFSLLSEKSILQHSVATKEWDNEAFDVAIVEMMSHPATFASQLFTLRADNLINNTPLQTARARLSGLLIGLELASARTYWHDRNVAIVGRTDLAQLYMRGLQAQGVSPQTKNCEDMALLGMKAAYEILSRDIS